MKKTYVTTVPNHIGAFLSASRLLAALDVNITREKQQTYIRSATAESFAGLVPPRTLTLEESLEFASNDECCEVTPDAVRIRKIILDTQERFKVAARVRRGQA